MNRQPVIAILDVGKTNKKLFLIDEGYNIVAEYAQQLAEVTDEDGFPCEDLPKLHTQPEALKKGIGLAGGLSGGQLARLVPGLRPKAKVAEPSRHCFGVTPQKAKNDATPA